MKQQNFARLGIIVGLLYWPAEALLHTLFFTGGRFIDNLIPSDANEAWMRSLIALAFIAFGLFAEREMRVQQAMRTRLTQKSQRLQAIIDHTYDAYVGIDPSGTITGWNHSAELLFGWPLQKILGQPVTTIIPERLREAHQRGMQRYSEESVGTILYQPTATFGLHRDGFEFPIDIVVTPLASDDGQEFFAFIRERIRNNREQHKEQP